jgi:hypothetical protein
MPESALRAVERADAVLDASEIGTALARLVEPPVIREDQATMDVDNPLADSAERPNGPPSPFTCPECNGSLWEVRQGDVARHGERRPRLRDRFNGAAEDALHRAQLIREALGTRRERPHALDPQAATE